MAPQGRWLLSTRLESSARRCATVWTTTGRSPKLPFVSFILQPFPGQYHYPPELSQLHVKGQRLIKSKQRRKVTGPVAKQNSARRFSAPVFPTLERVKKWGDGWCRRHWGNYILIRVAEDLNCDTLFSSTWKGTCPLFFFPFAPSKSLGGAAVWRRRAICS